MPLNTYFSLNLSSLFLFLIFLTGCNSKIDPSETFDPEPISYLALGDSYTIGTGISEENNYPNQLTDSLTARGYTFDTTAVIATNGWTTTDLKNGIQSINPDTNYDLVSLLIGVNNQYQRLNIELYRTEFTELLEQAIEFAGGDTTAVFVISIPNYGVTPFAQSRDPERIEMEIQSYNEIAKVITTNYNIPYINITPISELAAGDTSWLASDELHPSAKMYSLWVDEMVPTVTHILH
jgi:lysophospholipase L1-like esterase